MKLEKTNKTTLGLSLKILRKERKLTLEELAADMGLGKSNVWQMEKGLTVPNFDAICFFTKFYQFDFINFSAIYDSDNFDEKTLKLKIEQHRLSSNKTESGNNNAEENRLKNMVIELQQELINLHKQINSKK